MKSAEDETSLDMDWVASLEKKVSDTKCWDTNRELTIYREPTIYRVPDILKRVDPQAYEPFLISLGPYHWDKPHLKAMNQVKWKYLKFVLQQNPRVALVKYLDEIKKLEPQARKAYSEPVNMNSNSFVEMMLLDGCFIMLIITEWNTAMTISEDPMLTPHVVVRDVFMLENQLPFAILETLYKCAYPSGKSFRNLTVQFISQHMLSQMQLPSENETFSHIIHLFLSCIDPTRNRDNGNQSSTFRFLCHSKLVKTLFVSFPSKLCLSLSSQVSKLCTVRDANPKEDFLKSGFPWIPSATVFNEAGIRFERKERAKSFLDITFNNGKLQIPQLQIDDETNSLLRNLIAYEQCSSNSKFHVTYYAQLMDYLIDTAADVELLQQHEIIASGLGDSQGVATLFNKLGMHVGYDPKYFYFKNVVEDMRKYRDTRCNKWCAKLNHDYFNNPWAAISLFGVLFIFLFTMIQTIFAILSYVRPRN